MAPIRRILKISKMPQSGPMPAIRKVGSVRSEKIEIPGEKNVGISERACESAVIPVIARPSVIRSGMRHSRNACSTFHGTTEGFINFRR